MRVKLWLHPKSHTSTIVGKKMYVTSMSEFTVLIRVDEKYPDDTSSGEILKCAYDALLSHEAVGENL